MSLEAETAFARAVCERLDTAMEEIAAAVEYDDFHSGFERALGNEFPNLARRRLVAALLAGIAERLFKRRSGGERDPAPVVDNLSIDVLARSEYRQPGPELSG